MGKLLYSVTMSVDGFILVLALRGRTYGDLVTPKRNDRYVPRTFIPAAR
jgi:hypothetical protein